MQLSPNEIKEEIERVRRNNYNQFIKKIRIRRARGFVDKVVEFNYPVTAIIGTNGGGKSTILGAAALAYKDVKPGQFFPKSFVGDQSMADWSIDYELIERSIKKDEIVSKTARFSSSKWRRDDFPSRKHEYIEIQRTVPAGEVAKYRKFIGKSDDEIVEMHLSQATIEAASSVLDKDVSNYRVAHLARDEFNKIYIGRSQNADYSQFHFGAGEASIISTIDRIENASENSLILIEEVENGLHPVAVKMFVNYLQVAARRKRLQIIFTTHSQDAIDQMPPEGIWAAINSNTFHGSLSIDSLRAVKGNVPDQRVIFVEDDFVREWVTNALGRYGADFFETTKVYPAGGYPSIIQYTQFHNQNPAIQIPAVGLVDGDIYDPDASGALPENCRFLGGGIPEATVFEYIYQNRIAHSSIIRQRCLLSAFDEERIVNAIEGARNSGSDPHIIFRILSERLNFASALHIRSGMIDVFNEYNEEFWRDTIEFVRARAP